MTNQTAKSRRSRIFHGIGALCCLLLLAVIFLAWEKRSTGKFIVTDAPLVVLTHVRVVDGTGAPAREDQVIVIESGRIKSIDDGSKASVPTGGKQIDLTGHTAIPGLVGMHEHLFYTTDAGARDVAANVSFARLYLASGVTTIRTGGTLSLENDQLTKKQVENGEWLGPKIHLTSPYINHRVGESLNPQQLAEQIDGWASEGVTSFKIYTNITRAELSAVVRAAHKRGLKVTGHLCAVGFREAADLGIDNLEHGLVVNTEFYSAKRTDQCPQRSDWLPELAKLDVMSPHVQEMIRELVSHGVAITSTLPIFETYAGQRFQIDPRMQYALTPQAYASCLSHIQREREDMRWPKLWEAVLKKEMQFEHEFVKAGGLLMAGTDPTGWGGVIAGFGDQRGLELLVEAGFTPEEAIRIATLNGALFLGEASRIGTLTVGKQADIIIVRGNPSSSISDIRNVELVFKDGVGYDSAKLIESVHGLVGGES
jgi:imidazolonepropionase-like amidohydrolase